MLSAGLTWPELGWGGTLKPAATAYLSVLRRVLVVVPAMLFERKAFCRYGCLVGRISGLYALFSPTEVRPASAKVCRTCTTKDCLHGNDAGYACPTSLCLQTLNANTYCTLCTECVKSCPHDNVAFNLRPFAADLLRVRKPRPDEAWLAIVLLSMTAFHGLTMTPPWRQVTDFISAVTGLRYLAAFSVGMAGILLALPVIYFLFIWLSRLVSRARDVSLRDMFLSYAYALLPIALFYHLVHNAMHFFMEGQNVILVLSDPLGNGWNLLGTAGWKLGSILSMPVVWKRQVALIALGHVYGLFVAHGLSRNLFLDRAQRLRSHVPMVALMLLMSSVSLWLVSQPMEMRTGL